MSPHLRPGEHRANVNGTTLRYRVVGQGPVLVIQSPGWGIGSAPYEGMLGPLEASFTLVHYDPRGSGGSATSPTSTLHVGTFVDDLEALRAHLGLETFLLAGHSHGGLIASHYAMKHPTRVRALLLLAPQLVGVPSHPDEVDAAVDPETSPDIAGAFEYLESMGGFHRMFSASTDEEATDFLRGIAPLYFKDARHAAKLRALLDARPLPIVTMQAVSAADGRFPLRERDLRKCAVPTLAVSGRFDLFCPPSHARQLVGTMPHARQRIFEESGHFAWIEEPDAFFAEVRAFLAHPTFIPAL